MKYIWQLTADEYLEIIEIAKKLGRKEGDSIEDVFIAYMEIKGKKPSGATELNKEELIAEYKSKGINILDMSKEEKKND